MQLLPKTLYGRISLIFWVLLICLAAAQYYVTNVVWGHSSDRLDQMLYAELAETLAEDLEPLLQSPIDTDEVGARIHKNVALNPMLDIYVLSSSGKILFSSENLDLLMYRRKTLQLPLADLKRFIEPTPNKSFPIYGPNPGEGPEKVIFSATKIIIEGQVGYLYVVLRGTFHHNAREGIADYYAISTGMLGTVAILLFTAAFGTALFFYVTKRFSQITTVVERIGDGELKARINSSNDDELGRLGRGIDEMANTIEATISKLEETDSLRRELVSHISHDLKGPITSAQGYLESLAENSSLTENERQRRYSIALQNLVSLSKLVSDLLDLSKLEVKAVEPDRSDFNLLDLVTEEILPRFEPIAAQSGVRLRAEYTEPLSLVYADMRMIERVLANLVQNAISYNESGGEVVVSLEERNARITIAVQDDGPGMEPGDLNRVFESFYRADKSRKKYAGSGLGLAIVKEILSAHGETIEVESTVGTGTVFRFALPLAQIKSKR